MRMYVYQSGLKNFWAGILALRYVSIIIMASSELVNYLRCYFDNVMAARKLAIHLHFLNIAVVKLPSLIR